MTQEVSNKTMDRDSRVSGTSRTGAQGPAANVRLIQN